VYRFDNAALPKAENVGVLQALFKDPEALRPGYTVEGITEEASFGTPAPKSSSKGTNGRWAETLTPEDVAEYEARAVRELGSECARWLATGVGPASD
jgi:hypothetical protein